MSRLALAELPTPIERAAWLDRDRREVWIKRDDQSSPIYGGGKVRKLEWMLANPPYAGDRPIVSVGGTGSHHLLALALFLRELNRELHALVFVQPWTEHVRRNFAVLVSSRAKLWVAKSRARLPWAWLRYHLIDRPKPVGLWMPAGASTGVGCLGFVQAGLELAAQIEQGVMPKPDVIYITAGTAGSCAGLALGLALARLPVRLHVVSSVERWAFNGMMLRRKLAEAQATLRRHGLAEAQGRAAGPWLADVGVEFELDHGQVGGGYGVPTAPARAAMELAAAHGLSLETTYTAKCLGALLHSPPPPRAQTVLFWNTHGANDLRRRVDPNWAARSPILVPAEPGGCSADQG